MIHIKIYVPSYFKNFKCIADKCPDTCCAGWEVNLDESSAEYYRTVGGITGEKLKRHLAYDSDGDPVFTLTDDNRCPFLDRNNLCELYISLGEKSLCPTCTLFPRFYDDFGDFREMGLGLGCPEAARIILGSGKPVTLEEYGETESSSEEPDTELLSFLLRARSRIFEIADDESLAFKEKISEILDYAEKIQSELTEVEPVSVRSDFSRCTDILSEMEYIDNERKVHFTTLTDEGFDKSIYISYSTDFEKLLKYYIYRYFLKSVCDYDVLTKVKYGIFACAVIGRSYAVKKNPDFEERVKIMYGYSKETEYSDVNLDILDCELYESFSSEDLIELF